MALLAAAPSGPEFSQSQDPFPWKTDVEAEEYLADPKKFILKRVKNFIGHFTAAHNNLILATYFLPPWHVFPNGTKLYRSDISIAEDIYQGKVGLCIARGPMCFLDEPESGRFFHGQKVEVGDWVVIDRATGAREIVLNKVHCRRVKDTEIVGITTNPRMIF